MVDFRRENVSFSPKWGISEEKMRDIRLNGRFLEEKTRDFRLNGGFEKTHDFRLNVGFWKRKRVIFT